MSVSSIMWKYAFTIGLKVLTCWWHRSEKKTNASAWWKTQGYILWQPRMSAYASFIIHQIAIEIFLSSPWPRCEPPISKQVSIFSTSPILQESDCPTACVHDIFLAQRVYKAVSLLPGPQLMEGGCFFFFSLSEHLVLCKLLRREQQLGTRKSQGQM